MLRFTFKDGSGELFTSHFVYEVGPGVFRLVYLTAKELPVVPGWTLYRRGRTYRVDRVDDDVLLTCTEVV